MDWFKSLHPIEKQLKKCPRISLSKEKQLNLKNQILRAIAVKAGEHVAQEERGFMVLIAKIKQYASNIVPSEYFRVLLKEKLTTLVEFKQPRFLEVFLRSRSAKKAFAMAVALIFIFTVVFNSTFKIQRAEASLLTTLVSVSGDVTIARDNNMVPGVAGMILKADDIIRTGKDSKAVIQFLDQSVSRLDENTEVKISRLFINPAHKAETVVELILHRGQLWTRVISLIDNLSRFQVKAENTLAVAKKKAAFNVSISPKKRTKITAIKNGVDLVVATDKKVVETTLVKGFAAEVRNTTALTSPKIAQEKNGDVHTEWVKDNLAQDEVYIETVKQGVKDQMQNQVSVLPGNPLYAVKQISENTNIALTFNDFDRQKKILAVAAEKLAAAEGLLEKGDKEGAASLIGEFQSQLNGVFSWIQEFELSHSSALSLELKTMLNELLSNYEKQLAVILPTDPMYALKSAVAETKVFVAPNSVQKAEEKMSQAGEKLFEAHDLMENGDSAAAAEQVQAYSAAISDVVSDAKQMSTDDKEQTVATLLDNKVQDLKSLEAITVPPVLGTTSVVEMPVQPVITGTSSTTEMVFPPIQTETPSLTDGSTTSVEGTTTVSAESLAAEKEAAATAASDLQKTVSDVKTETLTKIGEAVLDVQSNQTSASVLQSVENIKGMDVNGKPLVNMTVSKNRVTIKTDNKVISIVGSSTPPAASAVGTSTATPPSSTANSKTQVSPPAKP